MNYLSKKNQEKEPNTFDHNNFVTSDSKPPLYSFRKYRRKGWVAGGKEVGGRSDENKTAPRLHLASWNMPDFLHS